MKADYKDLIFTTRADDFLTACQTERLSMEFTRIAFGAGQHTDELDVLKSLTALKDERQSFPITSAARNEHGFDLHWKASNFGDGIETVTESYPIMEIGVYARIEDETDEILYAISTPNVDPEMRRIDWMPAYNGTQPADILLSAYVAIGEAAVTLQVLPDAAATVIEVNELREKIGAMDSRVKILEAAGTFTGHAYTLSSASWQLQSDGSFMQDIEAPEATTLHMPVVSFDGADLDVAVSNKLESVETLDGIIRFRSKLQPVVDMNPNIFLLLGNEVTP